MHLRIKIIAAVAVAMILFAAGSLAWINRGDSDIELYGHKGYSGVFPENTMKAFEGARDAGFTGSEVDVYESDNGDLMVFHDPDTGRVCQGKSDKIWHVNNSNRTKQRYLIPYQDELLLIPNLEEVLAFEKKSGQMVLLHIKAEPDEYEISEAGAEEVIRLIKKYGMERRVVVFARRDRDIELFFHKGIRVGQNSGSTDRAIINALVDSLSRNGGDTFLVNETKVMLSDDFGRSLVRYCHERNIRIGTYKTKRQESFQKMDSIGVDFAMSNWNLRGPDEEGKD